MIQLALNRTSAANGSHSQSVQLPAFFESTAGSTPDDSVASFAFMHTGGAEADQEGSAARVMRTSSANNGRTLALRHGPRVSSGHLTGASSRTSLCRVALGTGGSDAESLACRVGGSHPPDRSLSRHSDGACAQTPLSGTMQPGRGVAPWALYDSGGGTAPSATAENSSGSCLAAGVVQSPTGSGQATAVGPEPGGGAAAGTEAGGCAAAAGSEVNGGAGGPSADPADAMTGERAVGAAGGWRVRSGICVHGPRIGCLGLVWRPPVLSSPWPHDW
jgi:hypothetical protein